MESFDRSAIVMLVRSSRHDERVISRLHTNRGGVFMALMNKGRGRLTRVA